MDALPPVPPAIHCVAPELVKKGITYALISGDPAQLDALVAEFAPAWTLEAKAKDRGVAFARLKPGIGVAYKDLGYFIIKSQQRRLAVTTWTDPVICRPDDQ